MQNTSESRANTQKRGQPLVNLPVLIVNNIGLETYKFNLA